MPKAKKASAKKPVLQGGILKRFKRTSPLARLLAVIIFVGIGYFVINSLAANPCADRPLLSAGTASRYPSCVVWVKSKIGTTGGNGAQWGDKFNESVLQWKASNGLAATPSIDEAAWNVLLGKHNAPDPSTTQTGANDTPDANSPASYPDKASPTDPSISNVVAVSTSEVSVTWRASRDQGSGPRGSYASGLAKYEITRSGENGQRRFEANAGTTSFTDTGLKSNTSYRYKVRAVDRKGNVSGFSPEASATTLATLNDVDKLPPDAPASLAATGYTHEQVNLIWGAAMDKGGVFGSGLVGYKLFRNGNELTRELITTTGYTDTTIQPNRNYTYRVKAIDKAGNASPDSPEYKLRTPSKPAAIDVRDIDKEPPTTPTLKVTSRTFSTVAVEWTTSSDPNAPLLGSGVAGYKLYRNGKLYQDIKAPTHTFEDTSVKSGGTYRYKVKAYDAATKTNSSEFSNEVSVTTRGDDTAPSQPGNLWVNASSSTWVRVSWFPSSNCSPLRCPRESKFMGYQIKVDGKQYAVTEATQLEINGLKPDTKYQVAVSGYDEAGNYSRPATVSAQTTGHDQTKPTPPQNLKATATATQIALSWMPSYDAEGVKDYVVSRGKFHTTTVANRYVDTGRQPGVTYTYEVAARDINNNLSATAQVSVTTASDASLDTKTPTKPGKITARVLSSTSVQLIWDASSDNIGVAAYQIEKDGQVVERAWPGTVWTDESAQYGQTHHYAVKAIDINNNYSDSREAKVKVTQPIPSVEPDPPGKVKAKAFGSRMVEITWSAPKAAAWYYLYRNNDIYPLARVNGETKYRDVTAQAGATYTYSVVAYNIQGQPSQRALSNQVIMPARDTLNPPEPEGTDDSRGVSYRSIRLGVGQVKDNKGGSGIEHYEVYRDGKLTAITADPSKYTDTDLQPDTTYQYRVVAKDYDGNTSSTSEFSVSTKKAPETFTQFLSHQINEVINSLTSASWWPL